MQRKEAKNVEREAHYLKSRRGKENFRKETPLWSNIHTPLS
jgi:hypothetical protein